MKRFAMLLVLALAGCGGGGGGGKSAPDLSGDLKDVASEVNDMQKNTKEHGERINAMTDLEKVRPEENAHQQQLLDHLDALDVLMNDMMLCVDENGNPPDMDVMHSLLGDILEEADVHWGFMADAATMEDAWLEETLHQNAMDEIADVMMFMRGELEKEQGDYTCP